MSKKRIAVVLGVLLGLVLTVAAFAGGFSVVSYTDVSVRGYNPGPVTSPQYIQNGHFTNWNGQSPEFWKTYNNPSPLNPGWEVHLAFVDLAVGGEGRGVNNALGYFVRTGSTGSQYAGLSQQVNIPASGAYWVQVHITAWEHNVQSPYNSVAWYGFGSTDSPGSVTEWRELFPDQYVCENRAGICNHLGRKESVFIEAGSYLHVQMGMKFPDHQAWTVFILDDISITDFSDGISVDVKDFIDDGDILWDPQALR